MMAKAFLFLILTVFVNCKFSSSNKWCDFPCRNYGPHIKCRFESNVRSPACGKVFQGGLRAGEKRRIVNLHNSLRHKVASGREKRGNPGPQPPALEMPNLTWDNELAGIAQTWANQCDFNHACSDVVRFNVGQNIGTKSHGSVESIIRNWYNEVKDYNRTEVDHFELGRPSSLPMIGHYTQVVWAETTKIGCGAVRYIKIGNLLEMLYLVCNYGPAGNVGTLPVYKTA